MATLKACDISNPGSEVLDHDQSGHRSNGLELLRA